jgi:hypothetical protein
VSSSAVGAESCLVTGLFRDSIKAPECKDRPPESRTTNPFMALTSGPERSSPAETEDAQEFIICNCERKRILIRSNCSRKEIDRDKGSNGRTLQ